jgi:hypothetical protein
MEKDPTSDFLSLEKDLTPLEDTDVPESAENEVTFDQDLVEAFLEMEDVLELGTFISEFDKVRFKEIGYLLYQAFKQRGTYPDTKQLFALGDKDPLDFDNAVKITTDVILTTGNFKKLSKYVRVQLLYGLSLVKQESNAKIGDDAKEFIEEKWRLLKTDCIRQFSEVTDLELTHEMITELIKDYEKNNKPIEAMDLIQEFELFDVEIDWEKGIKTLIDAQQWDKLVSVLEQKPEFIKYAIDLMSNNKLVKHAAAIIERMNLDINDYPLVLERLQKKTIRYYLFNYVNGPTGQDYYPLWKIEDLFRGYNSMLAYIWEDLSFKKEARFHKNAKALAIRNSVYTEMRADVQEKLDKIEVTDEDMKIDWVEDRFGPISEPEKEYFRLPSTAKVTFIGSEEEIKLAEDLPKMTDLGVDCEWRPSLLKFNKTGVALLQIGNKEHVYLFDIAALYEWEALDDLLNHTFENCNIIGMSFHNDLRELGSRCPKLKFFKKINNLYDVQPIYASLYNQKEGMGLSKIVEAVIGQKVCKVEQMSNWELRPLRESQKHYAALDAYILVELFDRMAKYAEEHGSNIEDYKTTYEAGTINSKNMSSNAVDFNIHSKNIGSSLIKTIKLKPGQSLAVNSELMNVASSSEVKDLHSSSKEKEFKFCIDHNLNRLNKLLVHMGFESEKVNKKMNILERGMEFRLTV